MFQNFSQVDLLWMLVPGIGMIGYKIGLIAAVSKGAYKKEGD